MDAWTWGWIAAAVAVAAALVAGWGPRIAIGGATPPPDVDARAGRWLLAAVIGGALALYAPGLGGDFNVFDDPRQIHMDPTITHLTAANLVEVLSNYKGSSQELMYLSFQLNWFAAGDAYWAWYLPNLVVFAGILALVHRLAFHLLGHRAGAALATAIFATAPVNSELLSWMSERSHLLGLTFALAAVVAWFESGVPGRSRAGWLAASLVAFALSQMCKPIFLFVPAWLILFDVWRGRRGAASEKVLYFVLAAFFLAKAVRGGAEHGRISDGMLGGSYAATLLTDLNFVVEYGRSLLVPYETGLLPHRNAATGWWGVEGVASVLPVGFAPAASLVILLATTAIAAALSRRSGWHLPLLVLAASLVSLVTVLNVPWRGAFAAFEYRYTLSAHALVAVLLADVGLRAWAAASTVGSGGSVGRTAISAACGAYLAVGAGAARANTHAWRTSADYWVRNTELYPGDYDSNYFAAKALAKEDRHFAALAHLRVCEPNRRDSAVYRRMAESYDALGFEDEARTNYLRYYSRNRSDIASRQERRFRELGITDEMLKAARKLPVEADLWRALREQPATED